MANYFEQFGPATAVAEDEERKNYFAQFEPEPPAAPEPPPIPSMLPYEAPTPGGNMRIAQEQPIAPAPPIPSILPYQVPAEERPPAPPELAGPPLPSGTDVMLDAINRLGRTTATTLVKGAGDTLHVINELGQELGAATGDQPVKLGKSQVTKLADFLGKTAKQIEERKPGEQFPMAELAEGAPAQLATGAGAALAGAGEAAVSFPLMAFQGAASSYQGTYEAAKAAGASESEAKSSGIVAASKTAPELLLYLGAGKLGAATAAKILGPAASPLLKGIVGAGAALPANMLASGSIGAIEGRQYDLTNFAQDALFALYHGAGEYKGTTMAKRAAAGDELVHRGVDPSAPPPISRAEPPTGRPEPPIGRPEPPIARPEPPETVTPENMPEAAAALAAVNPFHLENVGIISMANPEHGGNFSIPVGATIEEARSLKEATDKTFAAKDKTTLDAASLARNNLFEQIQERVASKPPEPAPLEPDAPETAPAVGAARLTPTNEIVVRPDLMQYKASDDEGTGTNERERIQDKYDPLYAGNLILWEPLTPIKYGLRPGERYIVANGHHRHERAVKDGIEQQNAQIIREADGYSAGDARTLAAIANIKDGKGTIYDSTRLIREQAASRGEDEGLAIARQIGARSRQAASIALNATDDLYAAFINERVTPEATAAIADVAPKNPGLQRLGIQEALTGATPKDLANYIAALQTSPDLGAGPTAEQTDMFGNNDAALEAAKAQGKRASALQKEISEQISSVRGAARRPEKAAALGVDVKDPAALQAKLAQLAQFAQRASPERWKFDPEIRTMILDSGLKPAEMVDRLATAAAAPVVEEAAAPRRRPGYVEAEQFTMPLESQAFNLVGEEAIDGEARQKELEVNAENARIARENQNMGQQDLFETPEAPKPGEEIQTVLEEAAPPTTATAPIPAGPPPVPPTPPIRPQPEPADDPNFTALPVDLPEAVRFVKDLLGTAVTVRKRLRALGGEALGTFRYTEGPKGKGEVFLRADIADLLTAEEKGALRSEAETYAEGIGGTPKEKARNARERYEHLLNRAYEAAKGKPPVLALKVIMHEIGHAIDWMSDKMLRGRGNFFGHIRALKNYLTEVISLDPTQPMGHPITPRERVKLVKEAHEQLRKEMGPIKDVVSTILTEEPEFRITGITPADVIAMFGIDARETMPELYKWFAEQPAIVKKEIVRKAMKGLLDERLAELGAKKEQIGVKMVERTVHQKVGREPTQTEIQERFRKLFKEELQKRNLAELKTVKEEVSKAIAWWHGTEKMPPYYGTPVEMYAEAFSIFMNNPAALAKRAPTYSRLIWNYMDARPEAAAIYRKIQNQIRGAQVGDETERVMLDSWDDADKQSMEKARQKARNPGPGGSFSDNVSYHLFDRFGPTYRAADGTPEEGKVREAVNNFIYRESMDELILNRVNREVSRPLVQNSMEWRADLGRYMFYNRIIHERFNLFNPYGVTSARSLERINRMRQVLGEKRWGILGRAWERMRGIFEQHVLAPMKAEQMWGEDLEKIIEENIYYATNDVRPEENGNDGIERLIKDRYGGNDGPNIYRQIGTVKEIKNPATATILKMLSLAQATVRNRAKREVVEMLQKNYGTAGAIPARTKLVKTPQGVTYHEGIWVENKDVGTITYLRDGKKQMFYVPRLIADAFNKGNTIENRLVLGGLRLTNGLKATYTQWNYGFWPVNFIRDTAGWMIKMPGVFTPLHWGDEFPEAMRAARASLKGRKANVYADRFLERREAISRADPRGIKHAVNDEYELKLASYGSEPARWENEANKVSVFVKLWNSYRELGQIVERANKIAAMNYLDRPAFDKMPGWKKAEIVRERGGSPNFLNRGKSSPYVDFFGMFYNPWIQEARAVAHAARDTPYSFTAKAVAFIAMPSMVQVLAQAGAFGDDMRKKYRSIPDYDLSNYLVVPMFWADRANNKVAYMRLPLWEGARILHQLLWHTFTSRGSDVAALWGGTLPNANAMIKSAYMWSDYMISGNNPYDTWRGKNLLTDTQMQAAGGGFWNRVTNRENMGDLLKYTWNSLGGPIVYRFRNQVLDDPPTTKVEDFLGLPVVSNSLGRFFKVSSKGLDDLAKETGEPFETQRAQVRLGVQEIQRKLANGEALTDNERRLMHEPYAMQHFARTQKEHIKSQLSQDYKRTRGRPKEEKAAIMEELLNK